MGERSGTEARGAGVGVEDRTVATAMGPVSKGLRPPRKNSDTTANSTSATAVKAATAAATARAYSLTRTFKGLIAHLIFALGR